MWGFFRTRWERLSCAVERDMSPAVLPDEIYTANGGMRREVIGMTGAVSLIALLWLRSLSVATVISEAISSLRSCHKD